MERRIVVGVLVGALTAVGAAVVADDVARERTESGLAEEVQRQLPGVDSRPDVQIRGFPFLTQLAGGELHDVRVQAETADLQGLALQDVQVRLSDVSTARPTTAGYARMSAFAPLDGLSEALDVPADLRVEDDTLVTGVDVLGLALEIVLRPTAEGRSITIDVVELRAGGARIEPDDIPGLDTQLDGLSVPVAGLPEGLELTDVVLRPDGARLEAAGADVVLEQVAATAP